MITTGISMAFEFVSSIMFNIDCKASFESNRIVGDDHSAGPFIFIFILQNHNYYYHYYFKKRNILIFLKKKITLIIPPKTNPL